MIVVHGCAGGACTRHEAGVWQLACGISGSAFATRNCAARMRCSTTSRKSVLFSWVTVRPGKCNGRIWSSCVEVTPIKPILVKTPMTPSSQRIFCHEPMSCDGRRDEGYTGGGGGG